MASVFRSCVLATALLLPALHVSARAASAQACDAAKLRAAGVELRKRLTCLKQDTISARDTCFAAAAAQRAAAFEAAEMRGGCSIVGNSAAVGDVVAEVMNELSDAVGPSPFATPCSTAQTVAFRRFSRVLVKAYVRNSRLPDPPSLDAKVEAAERKFLKAFARASKKSDCQTDTTAPEAWNLLWSGVLRLVSSLEPPASCPCWTTESLDTMFPPDFFDEDERGGAVCGAPSWETSLTTADECLFTTLMGNEFILPRGGAAVSSGQCVLFGPDLDPENTGDCDGLPEPIPTTPAETAACVAALEASQAYQSWCQ
ncbi:MAG TPA: hypothetical protein VIS07_21590 [Candidatus Binatia bacterium]